MAAYGEEGRVHLLQHVFVVLSDNKPVCNFKRVFGSNKSMSGYHSGASLI
ncbi:hypothetical protein C5167_039765 [Papaver somniferum]|uniref:Uncharacterized protein n=1 Tax=Papaver somniferum TaxID=3469 RepID=A0A4Y7IH65_PAPSO|nr:hypothetical protein C5167_039765 [Papaver somniferum]